MNKTVESPYTEARKEWAERYGSYIKQRNIAALIAVLALLIALCSVGGVVYIGSQSKIDPYLVEIDRIGNAVNVRVADQAGDVRSKDLITSAQLAEFVNNTRAVTPDIQLQRKMIVKSYSLINNGDPASMYLNDFYCNGECDTNPFNRAKKETVEVKITSLLPQTDVTWQMEWLEIIRDRKGVQTGAPIRMKGLFTVYTETPETLEGILKNPTGLKIRDLSWSEQI
ncbi:VirB8/TrbF family protein [Kistimonas asteriae]|uniref:VirB8/TrbF family protein n=1 Tax=Kistimonas asteriae TaxID=517724 RepID=UPI001BAE32EF|nr:VirB8/TrbF family protein [Kistimonas asteriae]